MAKNENDVFFKSLSCGVDAEGMCSWFLFVCYYYTQYYCELSCPCFLVSCEWFPLGIYLELKMLLCRDAHLILLDTTDLEIVSLYTLPSS